MCSYTFSWGLVKELKVINVCNIVLCHDTWTLYQWYNWNYYQNLLFSWQHTFVSFCMQTGSEGIEREIGFIYFILQCKTIGKSQYLDILQHNHLETTIASNIWDFYLQEDTLCIAAVYPSIPKLQDTNTYQSTMFIYNHSLLHEHT